MFLTENSEEDYDAIISIKEKVEEIKTTKITYISSDGREFGSKIDCVEHEIGIQMDKIEYLDTEDSIIAADYVYHIRDIKEFLVLLERSRMYDEYFFDMKSEKKEELTPDLVAERYKFPCTLVLFNNGSFKVQDEKMFNIYKEIIENGE